MSIIFLTTSSKDNQNTKVAILGVLILAIPLAIIGWILPMSTQSWINYVAYPWGVFFIVISVIWMWQKKKEVFYINSNMIIML